MQYLDNHAHDYDAYEDVAGDHDDRDAIEPYDIVMFTLVFILMFFALLRLFCLAFFPDFYWRVYISIIGWLRQLFYQTDGNRTMAEEMQRRLDEVEREAKRVAKRKEREAWYQMFMTNYTMVCHDDSIWYSREKRKNM